MNVIAYLQSIFQEKSNEAIPNTPRQELDFLASKFVREKHDNGYFVNEMNHIYFDQLVKLVGWDRDLYHHLTFRKDNLELFFWVSGLEIMLDIGGERVRVYYQGSSFIDGGWVRKIIQDFHTVIQSSTDIESERKANLQQVILLQRSIVNRY